MGSGGAKSAEKLVVEASKKGTAGATWLKSGRAAALLKPHMLLGLGKGLWKGNVESAIQRLIEESRGVAWWLYPLAAGWVVLEVGLMGRKVARGRQFTAHSSQHT